MAPNISKSVLSHSIACVAHACAAPHRILVLERKFWRTFNRNAAVKGGFVMWRQSRNSALRSSHSPVPGVRPCSACSPGEKTPKENTTKENSRRKTPPTLTPTHPKEPKRNFRELKGPPEFCNSIPQQRKEVQRAWLIKIRPSGAQFWPEQKLCGHPRANPQSCQENLGFQYKIAVPSFGR